MKVSKYFKPEDFKLCYVENNFAYFTTQELSKQWGDDWDDVPFEYNAEIPYEPNEEDYDKDGKPAWEIIKIAFDGLWLQLPNYYCDNSPYSVKSINSGAVAWIYDDQNNKPIYAGTTLPEFIEFMKTYNEVYVPVKWYETDN